MDNYEILNNDSEEIWFEDKRLKDISLCELRQLFEYIGNNNDESITKNNTSVSEKENENFLFYFNWLLAWKLIWSFGMYFWLGSNR